MTKNNNEKIKNEILEWLNKRCEDTKKTTYWRVPHLLLEIEMLWGWSPNKSKEVIIEWLRKNKHQALPIFFADTWLYMGSVRGNKKWHIKYPGAGWFGHIKIIK